MDDKIDSNGMFKLKDTSNEIRFSKDFWDYFIRTHPKSSSMIFITPLYDTSNNYIHLKDTSFQFYNVVRLDSYHFISLLAESADEKEKEGSFLAELLFIQPDDNEAFNAQQKRIERRLNDYKMTPAIWKEFQKLKSILTCQDTSNHYIIVYKKQFVDKIFSLYK